MQLSTVFVGAFFAALLGPASAQSISWEVVNRFRVMENERQHNRLIEAVRNLAKSNSPRAPIVPPKVKDELGTKYNFDTQWSERADQYDHEWAHTRIRAVRVSVDGVGQRARCSWSENGKESVGNNCRNRIIKTIVGETIRVEVRVRDGARSFYRTADVVPRDVLVAVLGDSYASGEGNPHLWQTARPTTDRDTSRYPAIWWDTRCHRSLLAAPIQAAALMAERQKHLSVTLVSFACSGAEIGDGVRTRYSGRETVRQAREFWEEKATQGQPPTIPEANRKPNGTEKPDSYSLDSQLNALAALLCPRRPDGSSVTACSENNRLRPDVIVISVGGNDIGFGEIGRRILLSSPHAPTSSGLKAWRANREYELKPLFSKLASDYRSLAEDIRTRFAPRHTLLMEYMNPTRYGPGNGRLCGEGDELTNRFKAAVASKFESRDGSYLGFERNFSLFNALLTRGEGAFAEWVVSRLNDTIVAAAAENNWSVAGPAEVARLRNLRRNDGWRGVCARNSWLIGIGDSMTRQGWISRDPNHRYEAKLPAGGACTGVVDNGICKFDAGNITSGVLHMNFFGHYNAGRELMLKLEAMLRR